MQRILLQQVRLIFQQSLAVQTQAVLAAFPRDAATRKHGLAGIAHALLQLLLELFLLLGSAHETEIKAR